MNKTMNNMVGDDSSAYMSVDWIYEFVRSTFYASWVTCHAYKMGNMTKGQIEWKIRRAIRYFAEKDNTNVTYKEWLYWMKFNHDNSFPHILG